MEQSGKSLLELHEIVRQRIASVTIEATIKHITVFADKSGTTTTESRKVILTFDNDTRCEIEQHVALPTEY